MTSVRKSLHTLQKAAGDKGDLVGPGRTPLTSDKDSLKDNLLPKTAVDKENLAGTGTMPLTADKEPLKEIDLKDVNIENRDKASDLPTKLPKRKKTVSIAVQASTQLGKVTVEDLTGETPSENYWKSLSEQQRAALEATLKENEALVMENEELRKRNIVLQEEINVYKELVKESETLVEVLKEMLGDDNADESQLLENSYEA